jgi:hypothetical protein
MKMNHKIRKLRDPRLIHVPTGFKKLIPELLEAYPGEFDIKGKELISEYLLFYLSLIFLTQLARFDEDENDFVQLSNKAIRAYANNGESYLKWLEERGLIKCTGYQVGGKAKEYRFASKHKFQPGLLKNNDFVQKLENLRAKRKIQKLSNPTLKMLFDKTEGVKVTRGAKEWVTQNKEFSAHQKFMILWNLKAIEDRDLMGDFYLSESVKCGRVFHPFTNMKSRIREKYIEIDGEKPAELDLKCSQFQILYLFFRYWYKDAPENTRREFEIEIKRYWSHFQDGNEGLYETMAKVLGLDQIMDAKPARKAAKLKMIKWLFSPNYQNQWMAEKWEVSDAFDKLFPLLHKAIKEFKSTNPKGLAHELQKIESDAVIHKIAIGQICLLGFSFLTVHDSVVIPASQYEFVKNQIWIPTLKKLGFPQYCSFKDSFNSEFDEDEEINNLSMLA